MNRLAKWMMRLYPAAWRARYGDEMDALLADSGADAKTVADLLTGGIRMRFSSGSFLKLAMMLSVAGMLLGLGVSCLRKPQYVSKATLEMIPAPPTAQDVTPQLHEMIQREQERVFSLTRLSAMINDPRLELYSDQRRNAPLAYVVDEMRSHIHIDYVVLPGRQSTAFNILFSYPDKLKAQQTVNALVNAFVEQNQEMQRGDGHRSVGKVLQVLDPASLPISPASPDHIKFALFGCLFGFLLACVITVVGGGRYSPSSPMLATNE